MSRGEAARYPDKRSKNPIDPCSICKDSFRTGEHKEKFCPWQLCRKCGERGHIRYVCPLEETVFRYTVDDFKLESNIVDVEQELIALTHEFAEQFRGETEETVRNFKKKVQGLLQPLMGEVYSTISNEREKKKQHEAKRIGPSGTWNQESKIAKDNEPGAQGAQEPSGIVKQEPIQGADPRDVFDKEEWEDMVDFLVFWDALDVGDEGRLEEEVEELHNKYPVDETLNEHTEERDRKFLQLEKTRRTSKIKSRVTKEKTVSHDRREETDTTIDERWARELQRRRMATGWELGEKLAKAHGVGYEYGLARGKIDEKWEPENNGRTDDLLEGFYEDIGLASDQEMSDIFASARNFIKEAVSSYVTEAKKRMALQNNTQSEAQVHEDAFKDGFTRGKTVCMDKSGRNVRGDSEDVDFMMDEFYKDISLIRRSGAPETETQQIMDNVRNFMNKTVMTTIDGNIAAATGNKPSNNTKKFKFQKDKSTEAEGNKQEKNKVQTRAQTAATRDAPVE